jgi:hypothetical protein
MNKEVVGLALLRIQLVQGQAFPQRKVALDAKVMLTWVDSCIEIRSAFLTREEDKAELKAIIEAPSARRVTRGSAR